MRKAVMDKKAFYTDLQKKLIKLADDNRRDEIMPVLCAELKEVKLVPDNTLSYCGCGYPLYYGVEQIDHKNESSFSYSLIREILNEEADFDHFRLEYYCPKCGEFITEIQC